MFRVKKNTDNINSSVLKTKYEKTMKLSNWTICGSKKSKFIKKKEPSEILSNLGLKAPLSNTPLLGNILF